MMHRAPCHRSQRLYAYPEYTWRYRVAALGGLELLNHFGSPTYSLFLRGAKRRCGREIDMRILVQSANAVVSVGGRLLRRRCGLL